MKTRKEIMDSPGSELFFWYFDNPRDALEIAEDVIKIGRSGILKAINHCDFEGEPPPEEELLSPEDQTDLILEFAHEYVALRQRS